MLVPAIAKKEELTKRFAERMYSDEMFLYNGYAHCNQIPNLEAHENIYKWAIVNKESEVVGYLTYSIEMNYSVRNFGLFSFRNDPIVGIDLFKKMEELIANYHRVEWRMIGGNPVKRHYDKFCERHNGTCLPLHDVVIDGDGVYHDEYIYEIINPNR